MLSWHLKFESHLLCHPILSQISHIALLDELTSRWSVYEFSFGLDEKKKEATQRVHSKSLLKKKMC